MGQALRPIWVLLIAATLFAPADVLGWMAAGPCCCHDERTTETGLDAAPPHSCCTSSQPDDEQPSDDAPSEPCQPSDCECPRGCCTVSKAPIASDVGTGLGSALGDSPLLTPTRLRIAARQHHDDIEHPPQA